MSDRPSTLHWPVDIAKPALEGGKLIDSSTQSAATLPTPDLKAYRRLNGNAATSTGTHQPCWCQRGWCRTAAVCAAACAAGVLGHAWHELRKELAYLHAQAPQLEQELSELRARVEAVAGWRPPGLHWVAASSHGALDSILSRLSPPASATAALPEVLTDSAEFGLRAGSQLLRHSVERSAAHTGSIDRGGELLGSLLRAQKEDFPVALLFSVPKDTKQAASQFSSGHGISSNFEAPKASKIDNNGYELPASTQAPSPGATNTLGDVARAFANVQGPLLAQAEAARSPGGRWAGKVSPFGDIARLLETQETSLADLRALVLAEVSRLDSLLSAWAHGMQAELSTLQSQCQADAGKAPSSDRVESASRSDVVSPSAGPSMQMTDAERAVFSAEAQAAWDAWATLVKSQVPVENPPGG